MTDNSLEAKICVLGAQGELTHDSLTISLTMSRRRQDLAGRALRQRHLLPAQDSIDRWSLLRNQT
jgi:hypothetical protein